MPRPRSAASLAGLRMHGSRRFSVAGIAAYISYWHTYAVVRAHGETWITARLEPTGFRSGA